MFTPDPVDDLLAAEERLDHLIAQRRGERVRCLLDAVIDALVAPGILPTRAIDDARVALFAVLAEGLYGNAAIDVPPLRVSLGDEEHADVLE